MIFFTILAKLNFSTDASVLNRANVMMKILRNNWYGKDDYGEDDSSQANLISVRFLPVNRAPHFEKYIILYFELQPYQVKVKL